MLTLHFANRQEDLAALLLHALRPAGGDLFSADELIVPSAAMRRALTLQLARDRGVCAHLRFAYLAQWLWLQAGRVVAATAGDAPARPAEAQAPWQPVLLAWRIHGVLADQSWLAGQPRLARYLAQADAVTRLDLAQQLAALVDQYITYRPDWLAAWSAGRAAVAAGSPGADDEPWQAALWCRLQADIGAETRAAGAVDPTAAHALVAALARIDDRPATVQRLRQAGLPAAAHLFCLPTIAPVYLALLQQLARWMDLRIYAINPCEAYWFDIVDRRRLARLAAAGRLGADGGHAETGHRLLAAWGGQTQAQLAALVEACGDGVIDEDHYTPHPAPTLLGRLHNSILQLEDLAPGSVPALPGDRSIEVHVCHSLTRELEVLHDTLLAMRADPDPAKRPAPGEILVVTPDLDTAAPLIHAVFGTAPRALALPYSLTGQSVSQANAPARALLALLALAGSRCTASAVFGLLQQPVVARRFGLDDEGLAQVHRWLLDSGAHWGLDAAHRAALGLPAVARHSLVDALDRLMLGYALPGAAGEPFDHKLPAGAAEGTGALALGALWRFVEGLRQLQTEVAQPLLPTRWAALLHALIERFLRPDAGEADDAAALRAAIGTLADQWQRSGLAEPLPLDLLCQALTQTLDEPARGGVPGGRICFTSMSSLRGLPYKLICLIGLGDGAFPGGTRPAEFDLIALQPRPGDRQRRSDERNLFLDLLLSARDRVHISYTGRSVRDNAPLPPSVLVAELLDTLLPALALPPGQARARLVVEHALQAFDAAAFDPASEARLRSHHADYAQALARGVVAPPAVAADAAPDRADGTEDDETAADDDDEADDKAAAGPLPAFFARPLPAPGADWQRPTLESLLRFFRHPARALLQQRLGLRLAQPEDMLDDDEPMLPGWQSRAALAQRLLPAILANAAHAAHAADAAGADDAALIALAEAGTELPGGTLGRISLRAELPALRAHAAALAALSASPPLAPHAATLDIDVAGEPWQLQVLLDGLRPDGLLRHRYAEPRAADHIAAWIEHLALCACAPAGVAGRTRWLGRESAFGFRAVDDPLPLLQSLLGLYARGLREPLYFFPRTAWAWASHGRSASRAVAAWQVSTRAPWAEQGDAANRLALRGLADPMTEGWTQFEEAADAVLAPLLDHLESGGPA